MPSGNQINSKNYNVMIDLITGLNDTACTTTSVPRRERQGRFFKFVIQRRFEYDLVSFLLIVRPLDRLHRKCRVRREQIFLFTLDMGRLQQCKILDAVYKIVYASLVKLYAPHDTRLSFSRPAYELPGSFLTHRCGQEPGNSIF